MTHVRKILASQTNSFYQSYYQMTFVVLIASVFILIAMVSVVLYQVFHQPLPLFFAKSPNGNILKLTSHNEPNMLSSTLLTWASKAAVAAYTFDFVNYDKEVASAQPYFTANGWNEYQSSVLGLIQDISKKQLFVNGVVSGTPVISNQGDLPGKGYVWRIQLPFLVTFQSSEKTSRDRYKVVMTVVKVPTNISPRGIGIDQFVMR